MKRRRVFVYAVCMVAGFFLGRLMKNLLGDTLQVTLASFTVAMVAGVLLDRLLDPPGQP